MNALEKLRTSTTAAPVRAVHMNGRVYDPKLGRMLSPDPVTQAPENGQNYNRYTYAYNNPLKYTDPSGFENKKIVCESDSCSQAGGVSMGEVIVSGMDTSGGGSGITGNKAALGFAGSGGSSSPRGAAGDKADSGGSIVKEGEPVDISTAGTIDCNKTPEKCLAAKLNPDIEYFSNLKPQIAGIIDFHGIESVDIIPTKKIGRTVVEEIIKIIEYFKGDGSYHNEVEPDSLQNLYFEFGPGGQKCVTTAIDLEYVSKHRD